jgi:hypothetical protein
MELMGRNVSLLGPSLGKLTVRYVKLGKERRRLDRQFVNWPTEEKIAPREEIRKGAEEEGRKKFSIINKSV